MKVNSLQDLPGEAQLWIFGFEKPLSVGDKDRIRELLDPFISQWQSHQATVAGAYDFLDDHFVAVAGYCPEGLSGCSKDSCVANFKQLKTLQGLNALNRSLVFYRDSQGRIRSADRSKFQDLVAQGEIGPKTTVFDTTLQQLDQLSQRGFETAFQNSWHARAFR